MIMINNKKHEEIIKEISKDIINKKDILYIESMLKIIYELGTNERKFSTTTKSILDYMIEQNNEIAD